MHCIIRKTLLGYVLLILFSICSTYCPPQCECRNRMFDSTIIFNCSNGNLRVVPILPTPEMVMSWVLNDTHSIGNGSNITINRTGNSDGFNNLTFELNIENNRIESLPDLNSIGYANIKKIYATNNSIRSIRVDHLSNELLLLELSFNRLKTLDGNVLEFLNQTKSLKKLNLTGNPLEQKCSDEIHQFIRSHSDMIVYTEIPIVCNVTDEPTSGEVDEFYPYPSWIFILVASIGFSIGGLIALYIIYQPEIHVWLFTRNLCLACVAEDESEEDKKYDAYISYSYKDEEIVDILISELEKEPDPFKICVHISGFVVGESMQDSISKLIGNSHRTIIVLTLNFIETVWGRIESRIAHQNALAQKRTRLIIILCGDIGNINELDPDLKALLKTNTYLKWDDPKLYDKLRYALPYHSKFKGKTSNKLTSSTVVVVDDEENCSKNDK